MTTKPQVFTAFTLVELLCVIAIIGLLAAFLLPGISHSKNRAQQIVCVENLHQLGTGLQLMLANDHSYPLFMQNTNGSWIDQMNYEGLGDSREVTNFIHHGVWHCPTAQLSKREIAENLLLISYGYNSGGLMSDESAEINFGLGGHGVRRQISLKESEVVDASDMIAIGDVFVSRFSLTREPDYADMLYARQRHQGLANVVFCDGHVESLKLQFLFKDTNDLALRRWHYDHQPHRELLHP